MPLQILAIREVDGSVVPNRLGGEVEVQVHGDQGSCGRGDFEQHGVREAKAGEGGGPGRVRTADGFLRAPVNKVPELCSEARVRREEIRGLDPPWGACLRLCSAHPWAGLGLLAIAGEGKGGYIRE